jgi:hypothetical protein
MTAALVTALLALLTGAPLAMLLSPRHPEPRRRRRISEWQGSSHSEILRRASPTQDDGLRLLAEAYLLGIALQAATLFALSMCGVPWSCANAVGAIVVVAVVAALVVVRRGGWTIARPAFTVIDALTLIVVAGYARFATVASPTDADFIGIWGLKARVFDVARGVDWTFLAQPYNVFAHLDYPLLVPLAYDFQALVAGVWIDRWAGALNVGCGLATLLIVRSFLGREMRPLFASIVTLALVPLACSPYIGLAEGALVAFGTTALLEARDGAIGRAAVFLGLAASCKNEGLALIVAVAIALTVAGGARRVVRLWPAILIPLPWLIVSRAHGLHGDLTEGSVVARVLQHLGDPMPIVSALAAHPPGRLLFRLGLALALVIGIRRVVGRERFLAAAILLQMLAFVAAYVVTPHDVSWHVQWSWERLVMQLAVPLVFLAVVSMLDNHRELY